MIKIVSGDVVNLNSPKVVWMLDRGSALIKGLTESCPQSWKLHCGLHITRNLKAIGCMTYIPWFWKIRNAPTERAFNNAMEDLKAISPKTWGYLQNIENFEIWPLLAVGVSPLKLLTSNIAETWFSWMLVERFLPPYDFIRLLFVHIDEMNDKIIQKYAVQQHLLTDHARELLFKATADAQLYPCIGTVTDREKGIVMMKSTVANKAESTMFAVNTLEKTCAGCHAWQVMSNEFHNFMYG